MRPGANPEILTLASLSFKNGLPASLTEVQAIERAREKRKYEANLPPTTDEFNFNIRRKLMIAQELETWKFREREIDELQA